MAAQTRQIIQDNEENFARIEKDVALNHDSLLDIVKRVDSMEPKVEELHRIVELESKMKVIHEYFDMTTVRYDKLMSAVTSCIRAVTESTNNLNKIGTRVDLITITKLPEMSKQIIKNQNDYMKYLHEQEET